MKKVCVVFLLLSLLLSCACAEESSIIFHYPFGLSQESTPEQISSALEKIFGTRMTENGYLFPDNKELFGILVHSVKYYRDDSFGLHYMSISLDKEEPTADAILRVYSELLAAYGDPSYISIEKEEIDLSGSKRISIPIEDKESIQKAIDRYNLDGCIAWDNVSLQFMSYSLEILGRKEYTKTLEIDYAFSYGSLPFEVSNAYAAREETAP